MTKIISKEKAERIIKYNSIICKKCDDKCAIYEKEIKKLRDIKNSTSFTPRFNNSVIIKCKICDRKYPVYLYKIFDGKEKIDEVKKKIDDYSKNYLCENCQIKSTIDAHDVKDYLLDILDIPKNITHGIEIDKNGNIIISKFAKLKK